MLEYLGNKKVDDASHVYRGYRKQILFILYKILSGDKYSTFHPEGIEDFSIEKSGKVDAIFQVKDYSDPIVVSDISSGKSNSLIKRFIRYEKEHFGATISLAYFGALGPELQNVAENDSVTIQNVAKKISKKENIPVNKLFDLLQNIQFQKLSEKKLIDEINSIISSSQLGIDTENAKDLLFWWLFVQSEDKGNLTYEDVVEKIQNIGKFITERASHQEWLGSIVSFKTLISDDADSQKLKDNYLQGISATLDHISNGFDIVRQNKLDSIQKLFQKNNVVIIKGASGQGKTSLALRYFYDHLPMGLSYQIKEPENRSHAYRIAEAIIGHHKAFDMPLYLYYDVSITDSQWSYVLERFSNIKNVYLLISIRIEDWQRNNTNLYEKIAFEEIDLNFSEEEAEYLYKLIPQTQYLDFKASWADFGGKGPLLEYIYLLQNGEKLEDRLKAQIERIKKESNESKDDKELKLLRIIAQANSYGAKLNINKIEILKQLPSPEMILNKFHQEFLMKYSEGESYIEGFHPVRSQILCSILFDNRFHPWVNTFPESLHAIVEDDLESFLLYAFYYQDTQTIDTIIKKLHSFSPTQWIGYKGIIKALLWIGIKMYAEQNKALVDELKKNHPSLDFRIALDIDIGNSIPDLHNGLKELFEKTAPKVIPVIEDYQSRQTDKDGVFFIVKQWMTGHKGFQSLLSSEKELLSLAETAYWYGHLEIRTSLFENLASIIDDKFDQIDLQTMAEMTFCFSELDIKEIQKVFKKHKEKIFRLFTETYGVLFLEETDKEIKIDYILEINNDENQFQISEKENNNAKSMAVIQLLQKLYPEKEYYSTQGHGSKVILDLVNIPNSVRHDDTYKRIPKRNLPSPYLVQLNSTLIAYLQYYYRPLTWEEYLSRIIYLRRMIVDCFLRIIQGVKRYYKTKNPAVIVNSDTLPVLKNVIEELNKIPLFPQCAVDIWGFTSEEISSIADETEKDSDENAIKLQGKIASLQKYDGYRKNIRNLFTHSSNFLNHFSTFILNRINGKPDENYLALHNVLDAYNQLNGFHGEFKKCFLPLYSNFKDLDQFKQKEIKVYSQLFSSWFFFSFEPKKKITNTTESCDRAIRVFKKNKIIDSLKPYLQNGIVKYSIVDGLWENSKALWLIGDIPDISKLAEDDYSDFGDHFSGDFINRALRKSYKLFDSQQLIFLMKFHWNDICLCFTYKKKMLFKSIKKKDILSSLLNDNSHFFDFNIDDTFSFQEVGLNGCWETDEIDKVQSLLGNYVNLKASISHCVELLDVLDKKESKVNEELIKDYLFNQLNKSGTFFQGILDSLFDIHQIMEGRLSEESLCVATYKEFAGQYKMLFPNPSQETDGEFECHITTDILPDWKQRIDEMQELIYIFYILMIFDVIMK